MKRNISRIFALLLSFAIIFGAVPVVGASAADDLTLTYDFIGDEASVAGFAQGLITINPSTVNLL